MIVFYYIGKLIFLNLRLGGLFTRLFNNELLAVRNISTCSCPQNSHIVHLTTYIFFCITFRSRSTDWKNYKIVLFHTWSIWKQQLALSFIDSRIIILIHFSSPFFPLYLIFLNLEHTEDIIELIVHLIWITHQIWKQVFSVIVLLLSTNWSH